MPIFLVDTLSTFRVKYAIEAKSLEHALDELVMTEHGRTFGEVTQKWLGDQIVDGREVTVDELKAEVARFKEDEAEICSYWMEDKLIHRVDYNEDPSSK